MRQLPKHRREMRDKVRTVTQEVTGYALGNLLAQVKQAYQDLPHVQAYLEDVERDVMENTDRSIRPKSNTRWRLWD